MGYLSNGGPPVGGHLALERVPEMARDMTGARYAALAISNEQGDGLEHFLTAGIDAGTRRAIGHPPRGRGVLGDLILDPRPVRVADVRQHPSRYALPPGHPVMRSFLGVPIMIRGMAWGSLHLAEKAEGEFTEADEEAIVALASGVAETVRWNRRYQEKPVLA
jgi:two-component system, NarL family, sensor histidine kinase DevS